MTETNFKCGIEIHQQLDTDTKLFCQCPVKSVDSTPDRTVSRYLRSVKGESGEEDEAAKKEAQSLSRTVYQYHSETCCLVELDEEPPHSINQEALDTSLKFALMLDCEMPEEIQIMRKIVVDGSNTSGFQRTSMIGYDGSLETSKGEVGIQDIEIEEESAKLSGPPDKDNIFSLDRLGIPLIEVGTDTSIETPEHAREVAKKLGMLLRSTGKARRGLGTIRQDVNVSIPDGSRVEIKGFQDVDRIDELVRNEIKRQKNLIEIGTEIQGDPETFDVTEILEGSDSETVENLMGPEHKALAVRLPELSGRLNKEIIPGRRLVEELVDYAKNSGVNGLIHSDEDLGGYGLEEEFRELMKGQEEETAVAVIVAPEEDCERAASAVRERAQKLYSSEIPEETRRGKDDCTSEYLRPLPGSARMYPETDIPPVRLTEKKISNLESELPDTLDEIQQKAEDEIGRELASALRSKNQLHAYQSVTEQLNIENETAANFLVNDIPKLESEGYDVSEIQDRKTGLLGLLNREQFNSRQQLLTVAKNYIENPDISLQEAADEHETKMSSEEEIKQAVDKVIDQNAEMVETKGLQAKGPLMGDVMSEVEAEGSKVAQVLEDRLKEREE